MLTLNPQRRITAKMALEHEYFKEKLRVQMPRLLVDCNSKFEDKPRKKVKPSEQQIIL